MPDYLGGGTNYVKAGNDLGGGALGAIVNAWSKAKSAQINIATQQHLMDYQHNLGLERDKHKTIMNIAAQDAAGHINNHYQTAMEGIKTQELDKRATRQNELDTQLEQTKHLNKKEQMDLGANLDIKKTQKAGAVARANKKHAAKTDLNSMREISAGLHENSLDMSKGISPLVAGPNSLQNVGNALKGHPLLNPNPQPKPTPKPKPKPKPKPGNPPINPPGGASPDASEGGTTPPVVKPAKTKKPKKTGVM